MKTYYNFAYYYDKLITNDFYIDLANKINEIKPFNNILDLACGSGRLAFLLKRQDNFVTGLDLSNEMLMIANDKNLELKKGIEFVNQDMTNLTLPNNNYDLITCSLDSINYILDLKDVKKIFLDVYNALEKDGYFIFDTLTPFYRDEIVSEYYEKEKHDDFEYEWSVFKEDKMIKHQLLIKAQDKEYYEEHSQMIYELDDLEEELARIGFVFEKVEDEFSLEEDEFPARRYYYLKKEL